MPSTVNTQNIFINGLRLKGTRVNVFLSNKTRLHGVIAGFDDYTIVLESHGTQTLIYKTQITSITPQISERPIKVER